MTRYVIFFQEIIIYSLGLRIKLRGDLIHGTCFEFQQLCNFYFFLENRRLSYYLRLYFIIKYYIP